MDTGKRGSPLEKALGEVANIQAANQSRTEVLQKYNNWSSYDETVAVVKYRGHKVVADAVLKYLSDNKEVRVLDVAAGTGLVGEELNAHGFNNLDALDPSEGMLNTARHKNVYRNYIQEFFPCEKPSVKASSYDVLVVASGMIDGHLKCDCLPEMVRCVKTGGLVVISLTEKHLTMVAEYKDRLEPLMKQLEMEGQWTMLERGVIPNLYLESNGMLFVFKVTKPQS